jgi:CubicO group peptidase (beta-lactamase class C family)
MVPHVVLTYNAVGRVVGRICCALVALALLAGPVQKPAPISQAPGGEKPAIPAGLAGAVEEVDKSVSAALSKDNLGSITVGIVAEGRLAWTRSYGYADMEKKVRASRNTVYRIGSITKQFTGLMLLQLVERGKVRLSDPVEKYFPEVDTVQGRFAGSSPITLVQLATMTSGLDREPADLAKFTRGPVSDWEKVLVAALPHAKYAFEPDTHYLYSNIGYAILGAALARAAHRQYTDYVRENIFAPLAMAHTAFQPDAAIRASLAKGYDVVPERPSPVSSGLLGALGLAGSRQEGPSAQRVGVDTATPAREHEGRGYKVPSGGAYSTVDDLARFVAFESGVANEGVLKRATLEDNYSRVNSSDGSLRTGYGIGFQLTRRGDVVAYGHGGTVAGYNSAAIFHRPSHIGVIVLRNVGGGAVNVNTLALDIMTLLVAAREKARP